jgi:hypothetical protein
MAYSPVPTLARCTKCGYAIRFANYRHDPRSPLLGEHFECPKKPSRGQLRRVAAILDQIETGTGTGSETADARAVGLIRYPAVADSWKDERHNGVAADPLTDVQAIYDATRSPAERRRMLDLLADYAKDAAVMEWARLQRGRLSPEYGLRQALDAYLVSELPREAS